jgi:hypothetical protein
VSRLGQLPKFFLDRSLGRSHRARCFVITRGDLRSAEMVNRIIANQEAILTAVAEPGPYIYSVQVNRLSRLYPPS